MGLESGVNPKSKKINVLCLVSYNFLPAKMGGQKGIASFYFEGILIGVDLSGTIFQEG